jgi:mannose-6-phosphate isomerase-like protein (cupin superfamily)
MQAVVSLADLPPLTLPRGVVPGRLLLEGARFGVDHLALVLGESAPGFMLPLHRHAYEEVFLNHGGRGTYYVGEEVVEAGPGDVVLIPSMVPHKFANLGAETLYHTAIHATGTFIEDLLEP